MRKKLILTCSMSLRFWSIYSFEWTRDYKVSAERALSLGTNLVTAKRWGLPGKTIEMTQF